MTSCGGHRPRHAGGAHIVLNQPRIDALLASWRRLLPWSRRRAAPADPLGGDLGAVLRLDFVDGRADGRAAQGADAGADQRARRRVADGVADERAHARAAEGADAGAAIGIVRRTAARGRPAQANEQRRTSERECEGGFIAVSGGLSRRSRCGVRMVAIAASAGQGQTVLARAARRLARSSTRKHRHECARLAMRVERRTLNPLQIAYGAPLAMPHASCLDFQ